MNKKTGPGSVKPLRQPGKTNAKELNKDTYNLRNIISYGKNNSCWRWAHNQKFNTAWRSDFSWDRV